MNSLIISTVPRNFREGQAPSFIEMAEIIYSLDNTEYCSIDDIITYSDNISDFFSKKYGRDPDLIVVYESLMDDNVCNIFKKIDRKVLFITEDLHLRNLSSLKNAIEHSHIVLSRFNIISDLLGDNYNYINHFPLHCSKKFIGNSVSNDLAHVVHFGQLHCNPPNVNSSLISMNANQYDYRMKWHNIFTNNYQENYTYLRTSPDKLKEEIRRFSIGFASTYFPYTFTEKCRLEQGPIWAAHNTTVLKPRGYLVAKFFEIPGAGLLLLADPTGVEDFLDQMGFIDKINYFSINMDNHKNIMNFLMDKNNRDFIAQVRYNGNELVKNKHTIQNRKSLYEMIIGQSVG